ncbi:hypothetical protein H5T51_00355 [Candidatus Bathyarchaeota archaeon]|nr:hypothetical protein [Candidatus Bathyarchaeota archaeon]
MAEIHLFIVPALRSSARKAAELVKSQEYDVIFLNFPRNLQSLISDHVLGKITLIQALNRIKAEKLIPEPLNAWLYLNEPIIEALAGISKAEVYCYGDVDYHHMIAEAATKIASLTARAGATGKIDPEEWTRILKEYKMFEASRFEAETISIKAKGHSLCLTGLSGWKIAKHLRSMGHKVKVQCVERLYVFKPLEVLDALMEHNRLSPEVAERLIWCHVNFIRDYVLTSENLDEAYSKWIRSQRKLLIHQGGISKPAQT